MHIKNFLNAQLGDEVQCHDGIGTLKNVTLIKEGEAASQLRFVNYTVLPPETSIGHHRHGNDEEYYIVLEGEGRMYVDGESKRVVAGDIIVNKPFGEHGLVNDTEKDLKILVFEVGN